MSALRRLARAMKFDGDHPAGDGWWGGWLGGRKTAAGVDMDNWQALTLSTVYACIRGIAEDIAKMPMHLYQRTENGGRQRANGYPVARLLRVSPNPEMTAFDMRQTMTGWLLGWGNAYAEIERTNAGTPLHIWPLKPWRMTVRRVNGVIQYEYSPDLASSRKIPADDLLHLKLTGDGVMGYNVIRLARESMAEQVAIRQYGASYFGQGAVPPAILKHPGKLTKEAAENLRKGWQEKYGGADNRQKTAILEEGMDLVKMSFSPDEGQFLQSRAWGVAEICRWFRFPPHKAHDLSRSTFSNIEHQSLEYLSDCLQPHMVRWEQECDRKLLTREELEDMFFEHLSESLLRTDTKSRYEAYGRALTTGFMTLNEVRQRENLNPIEGGDGDEHLVPANMMTLKDAVSGEEDAEPAPAPPALPPPPADPAVPSPEEQTEQDQARARGIAHALEPTLAEAIRGVLRIEIDKAERAMRNGDDSLAFYPTHVDHVTRRLMPVVESFQRQLVAVGLVGFEPKPAAAIARSLADAHIETSVNELGKDAAAALQRWQGDRPETEAGVLAGLMADRAISRRS